MSTDHFVSFIKRENPKGLLDTSGIHSGTSSTSADFMELRWQSDTGSGATGVTRKDVLLFLEYCEKFILNGGVIGDGTDCPAM